MHVRLPPEESTIGQRFCVGTGLVSTIQKHILRRATKIQQLTCDLRHLDLIVPFFQRVSQQFGQLGDVHQTMRCRRQLQ
jgi:hypothetical protein